MKIGGRYEENDWSFKGAYKGGAINYSPAEGISLKIDDLGKILSGKPAPEFKNSDGELVIPDYSLVGIGRSPHYKEAVIHGIPVAYFEYPSGLLTGHNCQIKSIAPENLVNWTSRLYKTGFFFGSAAEARSLCEKELADRITVLFKK